MCVCARSHSPLRSLPPPPPLLTSRLAVRPFQQVQRPHRPARREQGQQVGLGGVGGDLRGGESGGEGGGLKRVFPSARGGALSARALGEGLPLFSPPPLPKRSAPHRPRQQSAPPPRAPPPCRVRPFRVDRVWGGGGRGVGDGGAQHAEGAVDRPRALADTQPLLPPQKAAPPLQTRPHRMARPSSGRGRRGAGQGGRGGRGGHSNGVSSGGDPENTVPPPPRARPPPPPPPLASHALLTPQPRPGPKREAGRGGRRGGEPTPTAARPQRKPPQKTRPPKARAAAPTLSAHTQSARAHIAPGPQTGAARERPPPWSSVSGSEQKKLQRV